MNKMNEKKLYIWRLATFLNTNGKTMSGAELAAHLNRNDFKTGYGTEFKGKKGTYKLIAETYKWVKHELGLKDEARNVADASYFRSCVPSSEMVTPASSAASATASPCGTLGVSSESGT